MALDTPSILAFAGLGLVLLVVSELGFRRQSLPFGTATRRRNRVVLTVVAVILLLRALVGAIA